MSARSAAAALVDIDGTLVDTNYLHVHAWATAFAEVEAPVEMWRLHRHMGMGGDKLVAAVAGEDVERRHGDQIRDRWEKGFDALLGEVRAFEGAVVLLRRLTEHGLQVVLATSGLPSHTDRALDVLGLGPKDYPMATSDDAAQTKPAPDLLAAAMQRVGASAALVVGDSVWDVEAAKRLGLPSVALLTGGFAESELVAAGAAAVYDDPAALAHDVPGALARAGHVVATSERLS